MSFVVSFDTDFTHEDLTKLVNAVGAKTDNPWWPQHPPKVLFHAGRAYRWRFAGADWKEADRERLFDALRTVRADARVRT